MGTDVVAKKRYTVEQIMVKLRQTEIAIGKAATDEVTHWR